VERAQRAASQVLQLEPFDSATYILLVNTYAAAGRWNEQQEVWTQMANKNIQKIPGILGYSEWQLERFYVDSEHLYSFSVFSFLFNFNCHIYN
jgi:hypothetical protein